MKFFLVEHECDGGCFGIAIHADEDDVRLSVDALLFYLTQFRIPIASYLHY